VVEIASNKSPATLSSSESTAVLADQIKTLLMIPDNEYYPEVGHRLLSQYTHDELAKCFNEMRSQGILVTDKSSSIRSYKLSQKYEQLIPPNNHQTNVCEREREKEREKI
jgi:hypothetical protein